MAGPWCQLQLPCGLVVWTYDEEGSLSLVEGRGGKCLCGVCGTHWRSPGAANQYSQTRALSDVAPDELHRGWVVVIDGDPYCLLCKKWCLELHRETKCHKHYVWSQWNGEGG